MQLTDAIRITRQKAFMTQEVFAKELSVTPSTINRWEHGSAKPNLTAMKRLKDFCDENGLDYEMLETAWFDAKKPE